MKNIYQLKCQKYIYCFIVKLFYCCCK